MRIALDARKLWDGGIGTYVRRLLLALAARPDAHEYVALLDPRDLGAVPWPAGRVREFAVRARKYGLDEHVAVPRVARRAGADLLHEPHYTLPLGWRGPAVVTVHDLIHVRFARFFPPGTALYARAMAGLATRRARLVITDSEHTKSDVVALLGTDAAKVRVIPLGVSPALAPRPSAEVEAYRRARALPAGYVLYVGARRAHKNLPLLLEAFARIAPAERPPLVLSGARWAAGDPLLRLAAHFGLADGIHFTGALPDEQALACLYSGAALYVHPALTEGFGLPPLEAMACGTPVLCSTGGALPETVGDAALLLPPRDPDPWAHAIVALLSDTERRQTLTRRGLERARRFTWEEAARRTVTVYEEAAR